MGNIPHIIHYCWFGDIEMPEKEKQCVESWKKFFPGYKFLLWNEKNFNYTLCTFARQAYENKKYAFVSDYVRAKVLYEYGGIYLDADVKVIKEFPSTSAPNGFMGFERRAFLGTAVLGTVPGNESIKELLRYYEKHEYIQKDGSVDNIANVSVLTEIMKKKGLKLGGEHQMTGGYEIFNREVFYPKKLSETDYKITEETSAVHMFTNSWLSDRERRRGTNRIWIEIIRPMLRGMKRIGILLIGDEKVRKIEIKLRNRLR